MLWRPLRPPCYYSLSHAAAEVYRQSGLVISRDPGMRYDAGSAVSVLISECGRSVCALESGPVRCEGDGSEVGG